jgi:succinate dehydrogenase/fumarate reductase flavoprotein subunit
MDCRGISDEDLEYMMHWLENEGNIAFKNNLQEEDIDLRKRAIEFMTYEMRMIGGIQHNEKCETSLKGLYAAGDEYGIGIGNAATFGWIAGYNAAQNANNSSSTSRELDGFKKNIEDKIGLVNEIKNRTGGPGWKEANIALQQIMFDYAGNVRSETMLQAGLSHLLRLREKVYKTIASANRHELAHCFEVINLIDIAEILFLGALERKETRNRHIRSDYPFTNPLLDKLLIAKKVNGIPIFEWRAVG